MAMIFQMLISLYIMGRLALLLAYLSRYKDMDISAIS